MSACVNRGVRLGPTVAAVLFGLLIGGGLGITVRHLYPPANSPAPLTGISGVKAEPLGATTNQAATRTPPPGQLPARVLLQVPYTTQAPLGNWAQHQESCEAATLIMVVSYWRHDPEIVINPGNAEAAIDQIDGWKPQPDLTDPLLGQLAQDHFGLGYEIIPNTPDGIREQIAAGRPIIAEVRTHGLGNRNYPGFSTHFEQPGWSVPHMVVIIGYDETGVFLNDAGVNNGRGYHITFAQLTHAIDDLDVHHPGLDQGQVLLVVADVVPAKVSRGIV